MYVCIYIHIYALIYLLFLGWGGTTRHFPEDRFVVNLVWMDFATPQSPGRERMFNDLIVETLCYFFVSKDFG